MATRLIGPAQRATDRARLEAMPRLEKASVTLMAVARTVLELLDGAEDPAVDLGQVWAAVERAGGPRTAVAGAVATVAELVPDPDAWEADNRQAIAARYRVVRPFVRLLAEQLPLGAAPAGTDLLIEVKGRLPGLLRRRVDQPSCTRRCAAATCSPIRRCARPIRARSCSTARTGPRCAARCWLASA